MGLTLSVARRQLEQQLKAGGADLDQLTAELRKHPELLRPGNGLTQHHCLAHVAAGVANAEAVACLLRLAAAHGGPAAAAAVANARNGRSQTPLMLAAGAAGGAPAVRALLAAGADPWAADSCGGRTALFYAAAADQAEAAAVLLDATDGAAIPAPSFPNGPTTAYADVRMLAGFTAMHVAVLADARAVLRLLLQARARFNVPTLFGSTDYIFCVRGTCPMHLAARHNRTEAAKMLLLAYYTANARGESVIDPRLLLDDKRRLPCHVAVAYGNMPLAHLLQPGLPISQVLGGAADLYLGGPPPLKLIAAAALRARQQKSLLVARCMLGLDAPACSPEACSARCGKAPPLSPGQRLHTASECDPAHTTRVHKDMGIELSGGPEDDDAAAAEANDYEEGSGAAPFNGPQLAHCDECCECCCNSSSNVSSFGPGGCLAASPGSCSSGSDAAAAVAAAGGCSTSDGACRDGAAPCDVELSVACSDDGGDDDTSCGVCFDAAPRIRMQPCGHSLCPDCCDGLFGMPYADTVLCPFCRSNVGAFIC